MNFEKSFKILQKLFLWNDVAVSKPKSFLWLFIHCLRFLTDANLGVEKITVCLPVGSMCEGRTNLTAGDISSMKQLHAPMNLLLVKGWSRSLAFMCVLCCAYEMEDFLQASIISSLKNDFKFKFNLKMCFCKLNAGSWDGCQRALTSDGWPPPLITQLLWWRFVWPGAFAQSMQQCKSLSPTRAWLNFVHTVEAGKLLLLNAFAVSVAITLQDWLLAPQQQGEGQTASTFSTNCDCWKLQRSRQGSLRPLRSMICVQKSCQCGFWYDDFHHSLDLMWFTRHGKA